MAAIDAAGYPPTFSINGTDYLEVICIKNWSLDGTTATTEEETFCGKKTGLGIPSYTGTATAVGDWALDADQVSAELMQAWWANKTALTFKVSIGASGVDLYAAGDAVITAFKLNFEVANSITFDFSWTVSNLDIAP